MIIFETDRLILRHLLPEDMDDFYTLYCDPDVIKYIPDAPESYAQAREELEWFQNGHPGDPRLGLWATLHKETGRFIGRCGLLPWKIDDIDEVEVAYALSREFWEQGLGTEVAKGLLNYGFGVLGLKRLICLIDQENLASIKVARKIGMSYEKDGEDEIGPFQVYSINADDLSDRTA